MVPPSTSAVCLGVEINTEKGSISIPQAKLRQICDSVSEWKNRKYCTKRQLQSLLGHLLYIHKCVKPARYFFNRMLQLLREYQGQTRIHLNPDFHRDLRWLSFCLSTMVFPCMTIKNGSPSTFVCMPSRSWRCMAKYGLPYVHTSWVQRFEHSAS